jgi:hypothetical protein
VSEAADALAALDDALADVGQDIKLRRTTGTQKIPFEVTCRAIVRGYAPEELIGGITQQDSFVILSPSEIERKGWPGPNSSATPTNKDRRIPHKGDAVTINGAPRNVEAAVGIYVSNDLVRIEMRVRG